MIDKSGTLSFEELRAAIEAKMLRQNRMDFHANEVIALEMSWRRELLDRDGKCQRCHATGELTLDHIIPAALLKELGFYPETFFDSDNYQILCKRCNMFKSRRLDFMNPMTKPLLLKYIDTVPGIRIVQQPVYEELP